LIRTIKAAMAEAGSVPFLFDDDSRMKIRTAAAVAVSPGGSVKSVYETQAELTIESQDGSSATFRLADPGSSAAVRDKMMRWNISGEPDRRLDDGSNALNLSKLRATDVAAFVQRHARRHSPSQARLKICKAFDIIRLVGARQRHLL
jgi:hypothetical protein